MNQEGLHRVSTRRHARREAPHPERALLHAVFAALAREAASLGIELPLAMPEAARRSRRVDPVSGDESVVCDWCNDWGQRAGTLVLNPDGGFYAEQQVFRRSPRDARWMIHSIRAWGWSGGKVHAEARLLPAP